MRLSVADSRGESAQGVWRHYTWRGDTSFIRMCGHVGVEKIDFLVTQALRPWLRENALSAMIRLAICRGAFMKRFVEGADRGQSTLLPECLDEWVEESNSVRVVDSFVDALDLADLGFEGVEAAATGRPAYHPSVLLKLYIYGYLNRVQSSRRLEREAGRNLEVIWLLGRLVPDDKVIADFRKDNGPAIRRVCASFVNLCRQMGVCTENLIRVDDEMESPKLAE